VQPPELPTARGVSTPPWARDGIQNDIYIDMGRLGDGAPCRHCGAPRFRAEGAWLACGCTATTAERLPQTDSVPNDLVALLTTSFVQRNARRVNTALALASRVMDDARHVGATASSSVYKVRHFRFRFSK
jgi:hypothetical protein